MQYHRKGNINFVTDLVWQKQTDNYKIKLNTYKNECKFDAYCKTTRLGISYGFGRLSRDENNKILKLKKAISLAIYIIESIDIEINIDQFICFRFNDDPNNLTYGYIILRRGMVLPEEGEFIGNILDVKAQIEILSKKYAIKNAIVPDDVPFYNNEAFATKAGIKIHKLDSVIDNKTSQLLSASDFYFWHTEKTRKVKIARLIPLNNSKKKIIISLLILMVLLFIFIYIKINNYFQEEIIMPQNNKPTIIHAYPAKVFLNSCLINFDKFMINIDGWQMISYKCSIHDIEITYKSNNGLKSTLENLIQNKLIFTKDLAKLTLPLKIDYKDMIDDKVLPLSGRVDSLVEAGEKLDFKVNFSNNSFLIQSNYSPIFLYNNNILSGLYISEIKMDFSNNGFFNWSIKGEFNAK